MVNQREKARAAARKGARAPTVSSTRSAPAFKHQGQQKSTQSGQSPMEEPEEEVAARPHWKIKLTPKAVSLLDTVSDTSEDDGKEAESAIQNLLGPGKDNDNEVVENFSRRTGNAGKQKLVASKGTTMSTYLDPDLDYQHLEDGVISDENVRISDSESDSDDEVEGVLHDNIPITGAENLYVNVIKSWSRSHSRTCLMGPWTASLSSQTLPGSTSDWRSLTNYWFLLRNSIWGTNLLLMPRDGRQMLLGALSILLR